jgi:hypothetical protein
VDQSLEHEEHRAAAAVGDVYCYLDDTVTAGVPQTPAKVQLKMPVGYEKSLSCRLSVPAGCIGLIVSWGGFTNVAGGTEIDLMYRPFGLMAEVRRAMNIYWNGAILDNIVPLQCAAKSDVWLRVKGAVGIASGEINGYYEKL